MKQIPISAEIFEVLKKRLADVLTPHFVYKQPDKGFGSERTEWELGGSGLPFMVSVRAWNTELCLNIEQYYLCAPSFVNVEKWEMK